MLDTQLSIPESFYKEEVKEGYLITSHKKELWACLLEMLHKFDCVCKKHNLTYWIDGGTMLGAVRHKGFIPWDDDLDVFMPRTDYDKLLAIASEEFTGNYFFQTDWTDDVWFCHSKIRRSDTAAFLTKDIPGKFNFNQGIFMDVFPFDNVPDDNREYEKFIKHLQLLKHEMLYARNRWWLYDRDNIELYNHCKCLRDEYDKLRRKYNNIPCKFSANLGLPSLNSDCRKENADLISTITLPFEMLNVPVPANYDNILTRLYGDYMTPVIGTSKHGDLLFDTNVSYKCYSFVEDYSSTDSSFYSFDCYYNYDSYVTYASIK